MVTERYEKIKNLIGDNSSNLREGYFIKYDINLYNEILEFTKDIENLKFPQRIWHWVNNYPNEYLCSCGNKITFHRNWRDGYRTACSAKCAQSKNSAKEKRQKTNILKWGVDNVSKSDEIKKRTEESNLKKWGTKSTFQNPSVREKWKQNMKSKWGVDHYFRTEDFKEKSKNYYLKKWGVTHQLQIDDVKMKIKSTCLQRYGVETYLNTPHSRSCIKKSNRSKPEDDIIKYLNEIGFYPKNNLNSIIPPYSLDIYIPEKNLAIEFNGLYWHSEKYKNKNYHLDKTLLCRESGIDLIHVWEDDWELRGEIIKSIISNRLGVTSRRVYARNCKIKECNNHATSEFLNKNHIQGYNKFSKSLGLYLGDELVSLMTFGFRSTNGKREYELIRFCNKINTLVTGAASKIFSYFMKNNPDIDTIISYADRSVFGGGLYKELGFSHIRHSGPNYWWVVDGVRRHRFSFNKKKLVSRGYDPLKTEVQIMTELGHFRIWGSGQDRWVWSKKK